ncbi:isoprenylcysteine carboxylmethyltransferase family protein [Actinoplanes sp. NPDC051633]|uniref:methyltransferase family protein n=1 Tax=Actinoplanes sp. NPDC051633 TaxID=3155670 RepID=UPI0034186621
MSANRHTEGLHSSPPSAGVGEAAASARPRETPGPADPAGARVIFIPPPLYFGVALAAGALLHRFVPAPIGGRPATAVLGALLLAGGLALVVSGVVGVVRHRTTIVPHHAVAALVTSGGYRISRNPMYTGLAVASLGAGLLIGSWWVLVLLPFAVAAIRLLVIAPEERYLTERFGTAYADYRSSVRRWL